MIESLIVDPRLRGMVKQCIDCGKNLLITNHNPKRCRTCYDRSRKKVEVRPKITIKKFIVNYHPLSNEVLRYLKKLRHRDRSLTEYLNLIEEYEEALKNGTV